MTLTREILDTDDSVFPNLEVSRYSFDELPDPYKKALTSPTNGTTVHMDGIAAHIRTLRSTNVTDVAADLREGVSRAYTSRNELRPRDVLLCARKPSIGGLLLTNDRRDTVGRSSTGQAADSTEGLQSRLKGVFPGTIYFLSGGTDVDGVHANVLEETSVQIIGTVRHLMIDGLQSGYLSLSGKIGDGFIGMNGNRVNELPVDIDPNSVGSVAYYIAEKVETV